MKEHNTYTGIIKYKEIEFTFVFDKKTLKLIPSKDKEEEVSKWFLAEIGPGIYTFGEPLYITEILYGISNETGQKIIFIPSHKDVGQINSMLIIDVEYYILNKYDRENFDRIAIKGPEITHIFPTTLALDKLDWENDGKIGVSTKPFSETTTEKEKFKLDNNDIFIYFGISIASTYKTGESPIKLISTMFVEFKPTNDYEFIVRLLRIMKKFIQYLCYRKNVTFSSIEIASPTTKGLHETFATVNYLKDNNIVEKYPNEKGKFIKYEYIKGYIGKIISDIASNNLYMEHVPETYELGRNINAGKFVMITAAFEWEFKRNYPSGIPKTEKTILAEKKVTESIMQEIKENSGKVKEIFKFLKKLVATDNFESRIIAYGNDYSNISNIFGEYLYSLNNEEFDYKKMGERLAKQRNHFAHGDIDKEFIGLSLLDLIYLEYIIYIMQLNFYGVSEKNVKNAVKDLFSCNVVL